MRPPDLAALVSTSTITRIGRVADSVATVARIAPHAVSVRTIRNTAPIVPSVAEPSGRIPV